jgi:PBP1b-binding outer membrane lipoprotein LpoB
VLYLLKTLKYNIMKVIKSLVILILLFSACQSNQTTKVESLSNIHKIVVQEVLQVSDYTYLRVLENGTEEWIATSKINAEPGNVYYYKKGMEMPNFESKELNKTFETIIFVDRISADTNFTVDKTVISTDNIDLSGKATKPVLEKENVTIDHEDGVITIAKLYENMEKYEGKIVSIKGKVTKFNPAIMNKNWIHLQDGTDYEGNFDLTVTTDIEVHVGDVITIHGIVSLDKDFGAGYRYKVILENGILVN